MNDRFTHFIFDRFVHFLAFAMCELEDSWSHKLMLDPQELSMLSRSISVELEIIDTSPNSKVPSNIDLDGKSKIQVIIIELNYRFVQENYQSILL